VHKGSSMHRGRSALKGSSMQKSGDGSIKARSQWQDVWARLKRNRVAILGLCILAGLFFIAIFADVIVSYNQTLTQNVRNRLQPPSAENWFGTDGFGRDVFARVIHGSRISLAVGFFTVLSSLIVGGFIGSITAYYGGIVDIVIMRFIDILMSVPYVLLCICLVTVLGPGMINLVIAMSIGSVATFAVTVRSAIFTVKNTDFVEAAKASGVNVPRIILKHLLPSTMGPVIVQATISVGGCILSAASLSFVGLGIMPPTPEWGAILTEGKQFIREAPYLIMIPGVFIGLTVLSLNLLGDGLRDALDPRLR